MLLYILLGLFVLIALILIAASRKPDTVHYERDIVIYASAEHVLDHISDFRKWAAWSPWEKKDPNMKRDYSGSDRGVGAKYGWTGNNKVGEGTMEVLETKPNAVKIDLRFVRPFKSDCISSFHLTPQGQGTNVRWTMDGPQIFMGKVMSLFMNMDKMIGKDFEAGLANLKAQAERN